MVKRFILLSVIYFNLINNVFAQCDISNTSNHNCNANTYCNTLLTNGSTNGTISINSNVTLTLTNGLDLSNIGAGTQILIMGSLNITSGGLTLGPNSPTITISSTGNLNVVGGIVASSGSINNNGSLLILDGGINFTGGTGLVSDGIIDITGNSSFNNCQFTVNKNNYTIFRNNLIFDNNAIMNISEQSNLTVNGNLTYGNTTTTQTGNINGKVTVGGNFASNNSGNISGTGLLTTNGTLSTNGGTTLFGNSFNCTSGPCFGKTCGYVMVSDNKICSGESASITGNTITNADTYSWESSTTSSNSGFNSTLNITSNYTPTNINATTWYRRAVVDIIPPSSGCNSQYSNIIKISVASGTPSVTISTTKNTICGANTTLTFYALSENNGITSYQWYKNNVAISGATSFSYSSNGFSNDDQMKCVITTCNNSYTSNVITINSLLPNFNTHPNTNNINYCQNTTSTNLSVSTNPASSSYQWYSNAAQSNAGGNALSGETSSNYTPSSTTIGTLYYYCKATHSGCENTSNISGAISILTLPNAGTVSGSNSVCEGSNFTTLTLSNYSGNITKWQSADNNTFTTNLSDINETTSTPSFSNLIQNKYYRAVVTDGNCNNTSTTGTITIKQTTNITVHPISQSTCEGSNITLSVSASGSGTLNYQWKRWGATLSDNTNYAGTNTATLTISNINSSLSGNFSVSVTGDCPSSPISSNDATLDVKTAPTISSQPSSHFACTNGNAELEIYAFGGSLNYQWYENGNALSNSSNYSGVTSTKLQINNFTNLMSGNAYYVSVSNGCGTPISSHIATINTTPLVTPAVSISTFSNTNCSGSPVTISTSTNNGGGNPKYYWYKDGILVDSNSNILTRTDLTNNTEIYCSLKSNTQCPDMNPVTSNTLIFHLPNSTPSWTGNFDNNWHNSANWCSNVLPNSGDDVTLLSGLARYPEISTNSYCKNLNINTGAALTILAGGNLDINADMQNQGDLICKDASKITFSGTTGTHYIKGNPVQNLYNITKSGNDTLKIDNNVQININRGGHISIVGGVLDLNNQVLKLKSKISSLYIDSTASFGAIQNSSMLINASNFTLERHNFAKRGIRYIGSPIINSTVSNIKDSSKIYGPLAGGFDAPNIINATIKAFQESKSADVDKCFVSLTTTSSPLTIGQGFNHYVYGKRTTPGGANEEVTYVFKGIPYMGSFTFPLSYTSAASQGWNLIANPYPSAIDWESSAWIKSNIEDAFYIWDPKQGTSGGYYTYTSGIGSNPSRPNGNIISSCQGFFVKANSNLANLTCSEEIKVSTNTFTISNFRKIQKEFVTISITNENGDKDYLTFYKTEGGEINRKATKLRNSSINISAKNGINEYAIYPINTNEYFNIPIEISNMAQNKIQITIDTINGEFEDIKLLNNISGSAYDINPETKITIDGNLFKNNSFSILNSKTITTLGVATPLSSNFKIYPTVLSQNKVINIETNEKSHLKIYDLNGNKIFENDFEDKTSLDFFYKVPSGIYVCEISGIKQNIRVKMVNTDE